MWRYWINEGHVVIAVYQVKESSINWWNFAQVTSPESITRARRKAQELHPELRATRPIEQNRRKKESSKGTFIFRD